MTSLNDRQPELQDAWNLKWRQPCIRCGITHTTAVRVSFIHLNRKNRLFSLNYIHCYKRLDSEIAAEIDKCICLCNACFTVFCGDMAIFHKNEILRKIREYNRNYMKKYYAKNRESQIARQKISNTKHKDARNAWKRENRRRKRESAEVI